MPKTITCAICGNEVSKRQSLNIGGGKRACRTHEQTTVASKEEQAKIRQANESRKEKLRKKFRPPKLKHIDRIVPRCFNCKREGLRQDEWFLTLLKLGEQYEITYGKPLNPFDPEENAKAYSPIKGKVCIFVVATDEVENKLNNKLNNKLKLDNDSRIAADLLGIVGLCMDCCKLIDHDPMPPLEDFEQLSKHAIIYEAVFRPEVKQLATKELVKRN